MISLDSPRWSEMEHAYGHASDIPALLAQLATLPACEGQAEPWFTLWSALAHQGDVYPASYAAVPHVVQVLASAPEKADYAYFQFPAWVEICRRNIGERVPSDLEAAYFAALADLPNLVARAAVRDWPPDLLSAALAAIAVVKGEAVVAEVVLELDAEEAREFMEWRYRDGNA